jgi:hypothetical protein
MPSDFFLLHAGLPLQGEGMGKLAAHRLALCQACPHFNDDVNTGAPINPPCGLAKRWCTRAWRSAMASNAKHPNNECPWNKE